MNALSKISHIDPLSILDIGANCGYFSKECHSIWPNASIFMIEGNPVCEPMLKETGFPFMITLLSDAVKDAIFYQRSCGGTSTGDSLYLEDTPWYSTENLIQSKRQTTTLNELYKNESKSFDFIKLDVQGSEIDILRGGEEIVSKAKHILLEVPAANSKPYNIGSPTNEEVLSYMNKIGFYPSIEIEEILHPIERYLIQKDILFSRII